MYKISSIFLFTFFLFSCSSESPELPCNGYNYNSISNEFYGKWQSIFTGTSKVLDNCTQITIDDSISTPTQLAITNLDTTSNNVVTDTWLRRPSIPAEVRVKVSSPYRSSNQNYDLCPPQTLGVCAAQIFLTNNQTEETITTTTPTFDKNTETIINNVPPGEYTFQAYTSDTNSSVAVTDNVIIGNIETQLGTYNVVEGTESNFKTEILMDKEFVYGDYELNTGSIITTNIGDAEGVNLTYAFDTSHPSIESVIILSTQLGSISVGGTSITRFSIAFKYIDDTSINIPIPVEVTVDNQDIWYNTAYVKVYKNKVIVSATSTNPDSSNLADGRLHGFLITDNSQYFSLYSSSSVVTQSFPYIPNQQHYLILSSNSYERQLRYSIGINSEPLSRGQLNLLTAFSDYEPNNSIEDSYQLYLGDVIESYLHKDDVDSYSINMPDDALYHAAVTIVYADHKLYDGNYLDDIGNGDGVLNKGETAYLTLGVKNIGTSNSAQTLITLSTTDPNVSIENISSSNGIRNRTVQLNGLETRDTSASINRLDTNPYYLFPYQAFKVTLNPALPTTQSEVVFTLTATETPRSKSHVDVFTIPIE